MSRSFFRSITRSVAGCMVLLSSSQFVMANDFEADFNTPESLTPLVAGTETGNENEPVKRWYFTKLEAGINVGSTGLGINVASNIGDHVRLRAGLDFTPHINFPMSFGLESYTDGGGINSGNFEKMQRYMKKLTGFEVDDRVDIDGKPTMVNFKLLADYYPWADKGWRVTAGFYLGNRKVAKAVNTITEMPSLLAVNIYNHFYDFIMSDDAIDKPLFGDVYIDPFMIDDIRAELAEEGYMGIHIGDFKDGTPYMMQPDTDGLVKVNAFVNRFKPYLGLGFTDNFGKDNRFKLDVDCGALFWGGTPSIVTHDGVNLSTQVENIKGKPGRYVDVMKTFKVYPVISLTVSYCIF